MDAALIARYVLRQSLARFGAEDEGDQIIHFGSCEAGIVPRRDESVDDVAVAEVGEEDAHLQQVLMHRAGNVGIARHKALQRALKG